MEQDIQVNDEAIDGTGTQNNQTTATNAPDDQDALIAMLKQTWRQSVPNPATWMIN